jgi:hypothetical protein
MGILTADKAGGAAGNARNLKILRGNFQVPLTVHVCASCHTQKWLQLNRTEPYRYKGNSFPLRTYSSEAFTPNSVR